MARRDRTPRHKSHNQKKNKNPKLSPFQREQKRARLANQAPTLKSMGTDRDIPKSERLVFEYLQAKRAKQAEKRRLLMEQRAAGARSESGDNEVEEKERKEENDFESNDGVVESELTSRPHDSDRDSGSDRDGHDSPVEEAAPASVRSRGAKTSSAAVGKPATPAARAPRKPCRASGLASIPSLNAELRAEVGRPASAFQGRDAAKAAADSIDSTRPRTVEEIIARKKERKHLRKAEARRRRVQEKFAAMEDELADLVKNGGKKSLKTSRKGGESREEFNATFEKKLREMQAEKQREDERVRRMRKKLAAEGHDEASIAKVLRGETQAGGKRGSKAAAASSRSSDYHHSADDSAVAAAAAPSSSPSLEAAGKKKSISFDEEVEAVPHHAMRYPGDRGDTVTTNSSGRTADRRKRPRDFYELVDVVRYGERVDAPPVFDVVPNRSAAVSRLASQLEREQLMQPSTNHNNKYNNGRGASGKRERPGLVGIEPATSFSSSLMKSKTNHGKRASPSAAAAAAEERYRLLSSAGGMGEQKRLARLGLAPAITAPINLGNSDSGATAAPSSWKQTEMEILRDRVMATYRQKRGTDIARRKGVDLKHQFPKFA